MDNEAENFALRDTLDCPCKHFCRYPSLQFPLGVFGDSHPMIHFMTQLLKKMNHYSIYWELEQSKKSKI